MRASKLSRKVALSCAIAMVTAGSATLVQASVGDARSLGRGGTGVAHADGIRSVSANPALVNKAVGEPGFKGWLGFGVALEDPDDVIDTVDDIDDEIDRIEQRVNAGTIQPGDGDELIRLMRKIDGDDVFADVGVSMAFGLPRNDFANMALLVRNETSLGAGFLLDPNDVQRIRDAEQGQPFDGDDLDSRVMAAGFMVTEVGLTLGRAFELPEVGATDFAVTLKYQDIQVLEYLERINDVDDNEPDLDDDTRSHTGFNIDVGAYKTWLEGDVLQTGVSIRNLIPQSFKGPLGGKYKQRPHVTAGVQYDLNWVRISSDLDLTKQSMHEALDNRQFLRLGAEFPLGQAVQLRAGYRNDLKSTLNDVFTAGIGITPPGPFSFDLAAFGSGSNSAGATLQFGLEF